MTIIPSGMGAALAGAPLAQAKGSELERAQHDAEARQRQAQSEARATDAAGLAAAEGDSATEERDADGRRLWERPGTAQGAGQSAEPVFERRSIDVSGTSGQQLDLSG